MLFRSCLAPLAAVCQLSFLYFSQLLSLPASLCELRGLVELRLFRCLSLVELPDGVGALCSLKILKLLQRHQILNGASQCACVLEGSMRRHHPAFLRIEVVANALPERSNRLRGL